VTATAARYEATAKRVLVLVAPMKGPAPVTVWVTATMATLSVISAAPREPKRSAAQMTSGNSR